MLLFHRRSNTENPTHIIRFELWQAFHLPVMVLEGRSGGDLNLDIGNMHDRN